MQYKVGLNIDWQAKIKENEWSIIKKGNNDWLENRCGQLGDSQ